MTSVLLNNELKGIEIYFGSKPEQNIINSLKSIGYRWHGIKKCWYAKQNENTLAEANKFAVVIPEEVKSATKTNKETKISLWDLTTWNDIEVNNKLSTKEIAAEIRKHVRNRFPMCKFSVTSSYSSISFYISASPFEEESIYLNAIVDYCTKLIEAYHYCTHYDPYADYGSSYNFYGAYAKIDYSYTQTEVTEEIKKMMIEFDIKQAEFDKAEEQRKEAEFQEYLKQKEIESIQAEEKRQEEAKQESNIYNNVEVKELEEINQYFVIGSQFAHLNKNCTLEQYEEQVNNGNYELQDVKITRELHFSSEKALNDFSNMLLNDFTFIEGTGGSYTDDNRINSMTDYYNMDNEERETVKWNLKGIAVYYNNELQFIIDTQGYSYARYVGLVENVKIQKTLNSNQILSQDEKEELELKADTLIDISTSVICNNNLEKVWNGEKFSEYKQLMKDSLKRNEFKLTKSIIQQLSEDMEELKVAMYRLLVEVDGIQEQFKNADIQEGQKVTLFYIGDLGGITQQRITLNSVECTKYAQYDNAVKLTFTPQGKKKQYYNYWYSTILVYNGWLELPENVLNTIEDNGRFSIIKSKHSSCDNKQYDEILEYFAAQNIKPIVNTYKPEL